MKYDPESRSSRESLAIALLSKLHECGFSLEKRDHTDEAIYSREVNGTDGKTRVIVYTTVVKGRVPHCRPVGKDAIRVCAVYVSDRPGLGERGIVSDTRVNRTGEIEEIVARTYKRMRDVYKAASTGHKCDKCGAPTFTSKAGNQVCSDLCWKSDEEVAREARPRTNRPPRAYAGRWRRQS